MTTRTDSSTFNNLDILRYLSTYIEENGFSPTVREIAIQFGISSSASVQARLVAMEEVGWIERVGPRAIRLLQR